MNAADAIAFAALMLGLVSVIGVLADVYKRRLAFKERKLELAAKDNAEKAAHFAAQAQRLEQRVRVLERIATDRSGDETALLTQQIEELRDEAVN
jgi:type II secretory pathway component PulL